MVLLIYEKGEKKDVKNYRGTTLVDTGYKIYAEISRNRFEKELDEKKVLSDIQYGFKKERGSIDAVHMLKAALEREIENEREKALMMFADMKESFDNIKKGEIWKIFFFLKMEKKKGDRHLKDRIKEI